MVDLKTIDLGGPGRADIGSRRSPYSPGSALDRGSSGKLAGVEVIGDIEIFCRERRRIAPDTPFVAVTGTNGKSTTTALIGHVLKTAGRNTQIGGNIGTPILALDPPATGRFHMLLRCRPTRSI